MLHSKKKKQSWGTYFRSPQKTNFESDIICLRVTHISWRSQRKLNWLEATKYCFTESVCGRNNTRDVNPFSILERHGFCNEMEYREQHYHILSLKYISLVFLSKKVWNWEKIKQVIVYTEGCEYESSEVRNLLNSWSY